jgi:hypothetical protein
MANIPDKDCLYPEICRASGQCEYWLIRREGCVAYKLRVARKAEGVLWDKFLDSRLQLIEFWRQDGHTFDWIADKLGYDAWQVKRIWRATSLESGAQPKESGHKPQ